MIGKMQKKIVREKGIRVIGLLMLSVFIFLGPTRGLETMYTIRYGAEGDREFFALLLYLLLAFADGVCIYQFIQAVRGVYMRPFSEWCQAQRNPEKAKQELNDLYDHTVEHFQFRINQKLVMYAGRNGSFVANKDDIIWVYSSTSKPYTGNMQPQKAPTIHFHYSTAAPENVVEVEGGDEMCKQVMRYLQSAIPEAVFGYSDDMESMYETAHEFKEHAFEK
ncbi:MAG: DUF6709 family protein [Lachnospiraceae bacterium]